MGIFGHKNKNQTTTHKPTNDFSDNAYGGHDETNGAWDNDTHAGGGRHQDTQLQDTGYQQSGHDSSSGFSNPAHTNRNQAGIGSGAAAGTGMTGHHHQHQSQHHHDPVVGSAMLREQAMLRDREAQNFQAQSKELAEAEALEQKAREHRERAVAQGAHPHNKFLGGNADTAGGQGMPQTGSGKRTTGF